MITSNDQTRNGIAMLGLPKISIEMRNTVHPTGSGLGPRNELTSATLSPVLWSGHSREPGQTQRPYYNPGRRRATTTTTRRRGGPWTTDGAGSIVNNNNEPQISPDSARAWMGASCIPRDRQRRRKERKNGLLNRRRSILSCHKTASFTLSSLSHV